VVHHLVVRSMPKIVRKRMSYVEFGVVAKLRCNLPCHQYSCKGGLPNPLG